jgi:curli biogenesis system outer membrane secretion channel CsgG
MKTYKALNRPLLLTAVLTLLLAGCVTETHQPLPSNKVASAGTLYAGPRHTLCVANFDNRSTYLRGVFSDGVDRLGTQAKTILLADLQQTGRFTVVDRENLEAIKREAELRGAEQKLMGARYAVTGDVVEFGRRVSGDHQLWGLVGSSKQQVAYAKVTLNLVDVITSEVVYTADGAGEYILSNRDIVGFGGYAGYDSTLNGKVLDLAIREAVNRLVEGLEAGDWQPGKEE